MTKNQENYKSLTDEELKKVTGGGGRLEGGRLEIDPEGHTQLYKCNHCGQTIHAPADDPFFWFDKECHFCKQGRFYMA